jgi:hypothetical protein
VENTDFCVLLQAELDKSGISTELKKIQEIVRKYHLELTPDLQTASLKNQFKSICQEMANDFNKTFNTNVSANDIFKVYENKAKQLHQTIQRANKIQLSIDTGGYESKVESLIAKTQQWTDKSGEARINTEALSTALKNLGDASTALSNNNTIENQKALIAAEKELDTQIKTVTNSVKNMNAAYMKSSAVDNLRQKVRQFYDLNGKSHFNWGSDLKRIMNELGQGMEVPIAKGKQLEQEFIQIQNAARQAGKLGKTWFQTLREGMSSFSYWTSSTFLVMKAIQSVKGGISTVKALDTALVDLKKTTTMTASELEDFYYSSNKVAKQMGVTTEEIINQASAFSRLGWSSTDAATKMAKFSSQFASISPGMSVDEATTNLTSIIKAYDIKVDDILDGVLSKINQIGNTFGTSNAEIAEGLRLSSAAMASLGGTFEENIALFTAGQEILQDASQMGNAIRSITMRIKGYDEETQEFSKDVVEATGKVADLTKVASNNNMGISMFTDASQTHYKSLVDYLGQISDIWDEIDEKSQVALLQNLFGKNRAQAGAAIINNFDTVRKSLEAMENSAGSADREMSVIMDSLDYKLNRLSETGTSVAQNLFKRDDMKTVVDGLTSVMNVIDSLTSKLGLFGSIGLGAGLFTGWKNVGGWKNVSPICYLF